MKNKSIRHLTSCERFFKILPSESHCDPHLENQFCYFNGHTSFLWKPALLNMITYLIWPAWLWTPFGCLPESNPSSQNDSSLSWALEMGQSLKAVPKEGFQSQSSIPLHCATGTSEHSKMRDFWTICLKTKLGHTHSVLIDKLPIKCPEKRWELVRFIEWQGPGGCGHSGCSVFRLHACSSAESDAWTGRGRVTA